MHSLHPCLLSIHPTVRPSIYLAIHSSIYVRLTNLLFFCCQIKSSTFNQYVLRFSGVTKIVSLQVAIYFYLISLMCLGLVKMHKVSRSKVGDTYELCHSRRQILMGSIRDLDKGYEFR